MTVVNIFAIVQRSVVDLVLETTSSRHVGGLKRETDAIKKPRWFLGGQSLVSLNNWWFICLKQYIARQDTIQYTLIFTATSYLSPYTPHEWRNTNLFTLFYGPRGFFGPDNIQRSCASLLGIRVH